MNISRTKALVIALVMVGLAFVYRFYAGRPTNISYISDNAPSMGEPGSEHSHQAFAVSINGQAIDFSPDKFMGIDDHAHLHDNEGFFIHKHATGVTLAYFLKTLGITLTRDCITLGLPTGDGTQYCSNKESNLNIYLNRAPLKGDLDYYELRDGDKILIDYSNADETQLLLEVNGIPDLPDDLEQNG